MKSDFDSIEDAKFMTEHGHYTEHERRHGKRNQRRERPRNESEAPPPRASENNLASEVLECHEHRKRIYIDLKENQKGRYLKVTEAFGENRRTIIIPGEKIQELKELLERIGEFNSQTA